MPENENGLHGDGSVGKSASPALSAALAWLIQARNAAAVFGCSLLILAPVYWHRHVIAGDLGSHVYNAWLANQIADGQLPTLHLRPQYSNVLVDWLMSALLRHLSWIAVTRVTASLVVLVFFWGAFALGSAALRRPAWRFSPLLAMITYGFIFNFGFFNMYLSAGLAFWGLAVLWLGKRWDFAIPLLLFPLTILAHPFGTAFFAGFGIYLLLLRRSGPVLQVVFTGLAILVYFVGRGYALGHLNVLPPKNSFQYYAGFDQLILFGRDYESLCLIAAGIALIAVTLEVKKWRSNFERLRPWLLAYLLLVVVVVFSPEGFNAQGRMGLMGLMPARLSLLAAVFAYCVLGFCTPRIWHSVAFLGVAAVYFSFLYADTNRYDRLTTQAEHALAPLHFPQRVVQSHCPTFGRIFMEHYIEPACIGHCIMINNYELLSGQFRIYADPGSPFGKPPELWQILEAGAYVVEPEDLPLTEIHQCGPEMDRICVQDLQVGVQSGAALLDELRRSDYARKRAPARGPSHSPGL